MKKLLSIALALAVPLPFAVAPTAGAADALIKRVTFDEAAYIQDASVVGRDGWTVSGTESGGNSAVVVNDGGNNVLKITTAKAADTKLEYKLPVNDPGGAGVVKISYRVKRDSSSLALGGWDNEIGNVNLLGSPNHVKWTFDDGKNFTNENYDKDKGQHHDPINVNFNNWVTIEEYLYLSTNKIRATVNDGTSEVKVGHGGDARFAIAGDIVYAGVESIAFKLSWTWNESSANGACILYVDDIAVQRVDDPMPTQGVTPRFDPSAAHPSRPMEFGFTNPVSAANLSKALTITENGATEPLSDVSVTMSEDKKTAYVSVGDELKEGKTRYTLVIDKGLTDEMFGEMDGEYSLVITTLLSTKPFVEGYTSLDFSKAGAPSARADADSVSCSFDVQNLEGVSRGVSVIVAAYAAGNRMLGVKILPKQSVPPNGTLALSASLSGIEGVETLRVFVYGGDGVLRLSQSPLEW